MKKIIALMLCTVLCFGLAPAALAEGEGGVLTITDSLTITSDDTWNYDSVTIGEGGVLTIETGGRLELQAVSITNYGTIIVNEATEDDPPNEGRLEIRDDGDKPGLLTNNGQLTINGQVEIISGAELANSGTIKVDGFLRFAGGAVVTNSGTVTGGENGRIQLDNPSDAEAPLKITGLDFYDNAADAAVTADPNGQFLYDADSAKWVRDGGGPGPGSEGDPEGDGTLHTVTVILPENGSISAEEMVDYSVGVLDREDHVFTITPDDGYIVISVFVTSGDFVDDQSWNLHYNGDGSFDFLLEDVQSDLTLEVIFRQASLEELLNQNYVVLEEETDTTDEIKAVLAGQFASKGYAVSKDDILVHDVLTGGIASSGYGTFTFIVTLGEETSASQNGYIVDSFDDVIFKLTNGEGYTEIRVARNTSKPAAVYEVEVPAMHSGTMEIFGCGNLVAAPFASGLLTPDGKVPLPFNRAQFHIFSFSSGLNLHSFYVIQEDAFCVQVAAESGTGEQKTATWDLGRYADLTEGSYTSQVFFGNDEFILSLPSSDIGGVKTLEVETGVFSGYTVSDNEDGTYSVAFLSDYYDFVTINLTINGSIERQLNINRVGVHIEPYIYEDGPPSFQVFHGTQYGTLINFSDGNHYRVYGTYYIPDNGDSAPYGLYVIYTWQDGSKTTEIITEPCGSPTPGSAEFSDGVFHYDDNQANACDYLLYSGPKAKSAPAKINVTVLKGDPTAAGAFDGVFFGSGEGVTWAKK